MIAQHRLLRLAVVALILSACVGCDQFTKRIAQLRLKGEPVHSFCGDLFRLQYAENPGAFWASAATCPRRFRTALLIAVNGLIAVGLLGAVLFGWRMTPARTAGSALLLAGAIGNLIDRLRFDGLVIDFMNLGVGTRPQRHLQRGRHGDHGRRSVAGVARGQSCSVRYTAHRRVASWAAAKSLEKTAEKRRFLRFVTGFTPCPDRLAIIIMEGPIFELLRDRWVYWQRRQRTSGTSRENQVPLARSICAALVTVCAMHAGAAVAADTSTDDALQRGHAWARFGVGAWRQVRILTETFDEQGQVTSSSVADNLTTLEKVGPDGVTLKMEVTVEVAGQKFPSPPQFVQEGYAGETVGQTVSIKPLGDEKLTVDGREIACRSQQIEILGGGSKEVVQISYLPDSTPTILRRKSTTRDARRDHAGSHHRSFRTRQAPACLGRGHRASRLPHAAGAQDGTRHHHRLVGPRRQRAGRGCDPHFAETRFRGPAGPPHHAGAGRLWH